jgi:hypothetical protein
MSEIKNKDEMLQDLQFIKEAIKKNYSILKYISLNEGIKTVALLTGMIVVAICLVLLWVSNSYGSFIALPRSYKIAAYIVIALSTVGLGCLKSRLFLKIARRHKSDIKLTALARELYTRTLLMIMIPMMMTIAVFSVYFSISGLSHLIAPVIIILLALLMIAMVSVLNLKDFLLSQEWMLLSGFISLFIADKVSPLIIIIFTFGIGMFVLYFSAALAVGREKRGKIGRG